MEDMNLYKVNKKKLISKKALYVILILSFISLVSYTGMIKPHMIRTMKMATLNGYSQGMDEKLYDDNGLMEMENKAEELEVMLGYYQKIFNDQNIILDMINEIDRIIPNGIEVTGFSYNYEKFILSGEYVHDSDITNLISRFEEIDIIKDFCVVKITSNPGKPIMIFQLSWKIIE